MSARLDYLSKYLQKDEGTRKRKKKKKTSSGDNPSLSVLSSAPVIVCNQAPHAEAINEDEDSKQIIETESEDAPVMVESSNTHKQNMGFKRIDNGNLVERNLTTSNQEETQQSITDSSMLKVQPLTQGDTIYRDQSGRIVNLDEKRAEMNKRKENAEEEKVRLREAINLGDADKIRREAFAEKLENALRFDYSKTNEEYAKHMRQKDQFDDPLSAFASKDEEQLSSVTGRPIYEKGVQPVNRFNISAGYFWDGIDRSNGFEKKLVTKRNELKMKNVIEKNSKESYTEYDYE